MSIPPWGEKVERRVEEFCSRRRGSCSRVSLRREWGFRLRTKGRGGPDGRYWRQCENLRPCSRACGFYTCIHLCNKTTSRVQHLQY